MIVQSISTAGHPIGIMFNHTSTRPSKLPISNSSLIAKAVKCICGHAGIVMSKLKIIFNSKYAKYLLQVIFTRNSSGDEIANVNFLYDDIVHALKIQ